MKDLTDLYNRLQAGSLSATSELGARDEAIQNRSGVRGFKKFPFEEKKVYHVLIPKELAIPFNPFTGKADKEYNEGRKFRLSLSNTTSMLFVKKIANENPDAKVALVRYAGLDDTFVWDTTDLTKVNKDDKRILGRYVVARTFTEIQATIRSKNITGYDNGARNYRVDIVRDDARNVIGTRYDEDGVLDTRKPAWFEIASIFSSMTYEELKIVKELRENKDADWREKYVPRDPEISNFDIVALNDEDFKANIVRKINNCGLISEEMPVNYHIVYAFEHDNATGLIKDYSTIQAMSTTDIQQHMYLLKRSFKLNEELEKFALGQPNAIYDKSNDFFELKFSCPTTVQEGQMKKALLVQGTTYSNVSPSLLEEVVYQDESKTEVRARGYTTDFINAIQKLIINKQDDMENIEKLFKSSTRTSVLDEEVEGLLGREFVNMNLLASSSPFLTKETLLRNKGVILKYYQNSAEDFFIDLEAGLTEGVESKVTDEEKKALEAEMRELNSFDSSNRLELDDEDAPANEVPDTSTKVEAEEIQL